MKKIETEIRVLVVGSFVMDLIISTKKFPEAGETVLGSKYTTAAGGKGANQAVQAAKLGAEVYMFGKVGKDDFGEKLINSAKKYGVDTRHVLYDETVSSAVGNVQIESNEDGVKNKIIVVPGANHTISPEEVSFLEKTIKNFDIVLLQLEIPMEINELVAQYAFNVGVPVMLNPAPSDELSDELLKKLTYISPNEHEAEKITKIPIKNGEKIIEENVYANINYFLEKGVKNIIITLGEGGVAFGNKDIMTIIPSIEIEKVVDPTAAGDSFVGAFSTVISAGYEYDEALNFANHTAALTVSRMGAQPSLPNYIEVDEFINPNNNLRKNGGRGRK